MNYSKKQILRSIELSFFPQKVISFFVLKKIKSHSRIFYIGMIFINTYVMRDLTRKD